MARFTDGRESAKVTSNRLWDLYNLPSVSSEIALTATASITGYIDVPAGARVYRVGVQATAAVKGVVIDVGDGTESDWAIDGLTTLAANKIAIGPVFANDTVSGVAQDESGGKYYASADTIDLTISTACASGGGSIRLLAWWSRD